MPKEIENNYDLLDDSIVKVLEDDAKSQVYVHVLKTEVYLHELTSYLECQIEEYICFQKSLDEDGWLIEP